MRASSPSSCAQTAGSPSRRANQTGTGAFVPESLMVPTSQTRSGIRGVGRDGPVRRLAERLRVGQGLFRPVPAVQEAAGQRHSSEVQKTKAALVEGVRIILTGDPSLVKLENTPKVKQHLDMCKERTLARRPNARARARW